MKTDKKSSDVIGFLNSRLKVENKYESTAGGIVQLLSKQLRNARIYNIVMTACFISIIVFLVTRPTPVITVDASGKPVGQYEWYDKDARNQYEIMASAKRFVQHYTSLNANTIFEDAAIALNAMCEPLKEETQSTWEQQGYLARINNAGTVSRIEFDDQRSTLLNHEKGRASLRLIGTITVGLKQPETSTFDIALQLEMTPRTPINTLGVKICSIS